MSNQHVQPERAGTAAPPTEGARIRDHRRFLRAAFTLALSLWALRAQPEERRTHTWNGVPLAELVTIEAQGQAFRLPAGYLAPWPGPEMLGRINKKDSLSFAFWMPSRRYPEINRLNTASYRPREFGRDPPGPGEYIFAVSFAKFDASKEPGQITPRKGFENHVLLEGITDFSFRERFGILEYWHAAKPNAFTYYRDIEGTQPTVRLRCDRPDDRAPNPLCDGDIHFNDVDLQFWVKFSRNDIEGWRESVIAARELILSWRIR